MAWSEEALSDERDDKCLLIPAEMFFVAISWVVALVVDLGFVYGW